MDVHHGQHMIRFSITGMEFGFGIIIATTLCLGPSQGKQVVIGHFF